MLLAPRGQTAPMPARRAPCYLAGISAQPGGPGGYRRPYRLRPFPPHLVFLRRESERSSRRSSLDPLFRKRCSTSHCVVQTGVSSRFSPHHIRGFRSTQDAQHARAFSVLAHLCLTFELERHVLVAHGAQQCSVRCPILLHKYVVAHDALATYGNPKVWTLRSTQDSPVNNHAVSELYTEKLFP